MKTLVLGAGLLAGAVVLAGHPLARADDPPTHAVSEHAELLRLGEEALARGDAASAQRAFERAGSIQHAADGEMGLVRTYMQAGAYRRALAFAAHTTGAHREALAGAVLYAWLLHIGGQTAVAQRVLDRLDIRAPGDALAAHARAQLRSSAPLASGALLMPPCRLAPYDANPPLPDTARVVGSGLLVDGGRRALVPLATVSGVAMWLRDGLGRRSAASLERRVDALGLALVRLERPIEGEARLVLAPRDPFAGSPGFAASYVAAADATPAWPVLQPGFFGSPDGAEGLARLGIALGSRTPGGPVFDAGGRLAGLGVRGTDGQDRLLPVSALRRELGDMAGDVSRQASIERMAVDAIYEAALPLTLQILHASL